MSEYGVTVFTLSTESDFTVSLERVNHISIKPCGDGKTEAIEVVSIDTHMDTHILHLHENYF